ncbi:hypothetical protein J2X11_001093 [Aeromicrobium panaciterrae]|uniref:Zinc-finger domain-containing protein n=1 Tax=Aeromicrobium panaciterrae TaxID=363861 RepID=A0ABU1UM82_9ACTN|nr:hypothetical protein [Aeromicrobium panaciterrae]MDR7086254.1 hypothetical protein [Aeromicrobium panaciterrae]
MAHLGADVAAYVDAQLSPDAMRAASRHLEDCRACDKAVRQQRLLKSRMSTVTAPEPPAELLASLAGLAAQPPHHQTWWERLRHSVPFRASIVVAGASIAVMVAAYAVGGADDNTVGDKVAPPFDRYAADFYGAAAVQVGATISDTKLQDLDHDGWPCKETLGGDLDRTSGSWADDAVALSYSNGTSKLNLFEQTGVLDHTSLDGFEASTLGKSDVWIRDGSPMLVTWDYDGVVYTIVTDADHGRVVRAVNELPRGSGSEGPVDRVGDGLNRMTAWMAAA